MLWLCGWPPCSLPNAPQNAPPPPFARSALLINAPFLAVAVYALFYTSLDAGAGLSWAVCIGLPLWLGATAFKQQVWWGGGRCGGAGAV